MWVEMLWIPAFAGMTEETDGLDKSNPYIYIDNYTSLITLFYSMCYFSPTLFLLSLGFSFLYYILNTIYYLILAPVFSFSLLY